MITSSLCGVYTMDKDKPSAKTAKKIANKKAKDETSSQNRSPASMSNAAIFALIALYYVMRERWWMVAVCGCIAMGIGTNALAHADGRHPPAKRGLTLASYLFSLLAVVLSLYGVITKRF